MTSFALARARIGSARVLLLNLRGETLLAASRLQSDALIDLLRGKEIDSQRRAVLSDQIFNVNFVEEHRNAILATLAGRPKMKRRDSQDAMHAFEYFAAAEWQRLDAFKNNQAAIEGLVLDVVVLRMQVINPTEPTVKLLASAILCLIYGQDACDISLLEKIEMKSTVAKRIKARVRKVGHHVVEYCEEYPALPDKLAATHPALYERLKVDSKSLVAVPVAASWSQLQLQGEFGTTARQVCGFAGDSISADADDADDEHDADVATRWRPRQEQEQEQEPEQEQEQ